MLFGLGIGNVLDSIQIIGKTIIGIIIILVLGSQSQRVPLIKYIILVLLVKIVVVDLVGRELDRVQVILDNIGDTVPFMCFERNAASLISLVLFVLSDGLKNPLVAAFLAVATHMNTAKIRIILVDLGPNVHELTWAAVGLHTLVDGVHILVALLFDVE